MLDQDLVKREKELLRKREYYYKNREKFLERAKIYGKSEIRKAYLEKTKDQRKEYDKMRWQKVKASKPHLKALYNLTLEEYNLMSENQQHCCKTCKRHKSDLKRGLVVDHCHTSGKVRGLLCDYCNQALGFVRDDINTLKNLISYLDEQ